MYQALFPPPPHESLVPRPRPAFRRLQYGKAVEGLGPGIFYHVSDVEGREKILGRDDLLIERRRIVDVPTPVVV